VVRKICFFADARLWQDSVISTEGLEQEFNTLDAQRAAGEAFIQSQAASSWVCLPQHYDDGGYTGANMDPALQRLLADVDAGAIDAIVCYKIDRLSRSLLDFAKMMERFEQRGVANLRANVENLK
jgi:site-specific DNA recombinase